MIIFSKQILPRLQYMAQWLGMQLFGEPLHITDDSNILNSEFVLNYSEETLGGTGYKIVPHGLLFESVVQPQTIAMTEFDGLPAFFETPGDHGFDVLAASFYLLQRYEEYLPHKKDMYGRFAHTESLAFKAGFLKRPLVDEWLQQLKQKLVEAGCTNTFATTTCPAYIPTYDIDVAFGYHGKGWLRNAGGFIKSILQPKLFAERLRVLRNRQPDPFDVYHALAELHHRYDLKPICFFLLAAKRYGYDKNISPGSRWMKRLIEQTAAAHTTGIHPSWQSNFDAVLLDGEINRLQQITRQPVKHSRFHYIRGTLPHSYQWLIRRGILHEYSMGYGSINGYRASTCKPCLWYDLQQETGTALTIWPFSYMEANSIFEQKDSPEAALDEMQLFYHQAQAVNGSFTAIFHNHLIGHDAKGRAWWKMYQQFLAQNFTPAAPKTTAEGMTG